MNCDVCNKSLLDDNKAIVCGIEVNVLGANPARKKVEEIFGKNRFKICYVCWLKSLGVKPVGGHAEKPL